MSCSSSDDQIKKMWFVYIAEYYSTIKKNEVLDFAPKRIQLGIIMLRGITQSPKRQLFYMFWHEATNVEHTKLKEWFSPSGTEMWFLACVFIPVNMWSRGIFTFHLLDIMVRGKLSLWIESALKLQLCRNYWREERNGAREVWLFSWTVHTECILFSLY